MKRIALRIAALLLVLGGAGAAFAWGFGSRDAEDAPFSSSVVEATEVVVSSRVGGRLTSLAVAEGDEVEEGAIVARLDCAPLEARRAELEAQLDRARAEAQAAEASVAGVSAQRRGTASQARSARARAAALAAQREQAAREAERIDRIGEHATESQRDRTRSMADQLAQRVRAARSDAAALRSQTQATGAQRESVVARAEGARHAVAAMEAALETLALDLQECVVRAPRAGLVETVFHEAGELVGQGRPIVRLLDRRELEATLYVSNAGLASVAAGAPAQVRADPYGDEVFEGRVKTVAVEAVYTPRTVQTRSDRDRLVYPVTVALHDPEGRLLPGMPIEITLSEAHR